MKATETLSTGEIHGVKEMENDKYVVTYCGFRFAIDHGHFSDAKKPWKTNPQSIECKGCKQSNDYQRERERYFKDIGFIE